MTFARINVQQRSDAWYRERLGRLTGSRADAAASKPRNGKPTEKYLGMRLRLALERITSRTLDTSVLTRAMREGIEREPIARQLLEVQLRQPVYETGFLSAVECMAGASLDGHLGDMHTLVSIKCCGELEHGEVLKDSTYIPREYLNQILHEFWIVGDDAKEHLYVNFNPHFPPKLRLKVVTYKRNKLLFELGEYQTAAEQFLCDVEQDVALLMDMGGVNAIPTNPAA